MTILYVARHGETDWNAERRLQGHTDVPLNDVGRSQAQELARVLAEELREGPRPLVFASDLARARQTAETVAAALGARVHVARSLRERSFGAAEGRTWAELGRELPEPVAAYRAGDRDAIPGIEPMADFRSRVLRAARRAAAEADARGTRAVVVTHGGALKVLLHEVHGEGKRFVVENTALFRFEMSAGRLALAPRA